MIILAKSDKYNNFCIAGKDIKANEWIRPIVKNKELNGALTKEEIDCGNGNYCDKLSIVVFKNCLVIFYRISYIIYL